MLVLSRKREEKLQIGDDITVTILKVKGNSVQIGIEAPRSVRVLRTELATREPKCGGDADAQSPADSVSASSTPDRPSRRAAIRGPLRSLVARSTREVDAPMIADVQLV